jgi:hypothetical protein
MHDTGNREGRIGEKSCGKTQSREKTQNGAAKIPQQVLLDIEKPNEIGQPAGGAQHSSQRDNSELQYPTDLVFI